MASSYEVEVEVKTSAEKFWENIREFTTFYPKAMPHMYESIEILEGDGKSVGSVFVTTLKIEGPYEITKAKDKIVTMDDETKTLSYVSIGGDISKDFKSHRETINVISKDEGCVIKFTVTYEKANEEAPDQEVLFKDLGIKFFQDLDAYLINT